MVEGETMIAVEMKSIDQDIFSIKNQKVLQKTSSRSDQTEIKVLME